MQHWRMGWDSNPRYGFPYTHFPGVRLRPLGHPSIMPRTLRGAAETKSELRPAKPLTVALVSHRRRFYTRRRKELDRCMTARVRTVAFNGVEAAEVVARVAFTP